MSELEAKIGAVWKWANTVVDDELGTTELRRLADHVMNRDWTDEKNFEELWVPVTRVRVWGADERSSGK